MNYDFREYIWNAAMPLGEWGQIVLERLREKTDFDTWIFTRKSNNTWSVICVASRSYNILPGSKYPWSHSLCAAMVNGRAPQASPDIQQFCAFSNAEITKDFNIGSYIGAPVRNRDGSLFGSLCAIDPRCKSSAINEFLPLLEISADALRELFLQQNIITGQLEKIKELQHHTYTDLLTGVLNRNGWEAVIEHEQRKQSRYGGGLCFFVVDLDNLKNINDSEGHMEGDLLLQNTALCLKETLRESDVIARLGGDEFIVLSYACDKYSVKFLASRIISALGQHGILASVGYACSQDEESLSATINRADQHMYQQKFSKAQTKPIEEV